MCIALFPQVASIKSKDLEIEFQNKKDNNGNNIEKYYYNKGL
jgi:hypothetical protein